MPFKKVSMMALRGKLRRLTSTSQFVSDPVWMECSLIKVDWPEMILVRCRTGSGLKSQCFLPSFKIEGNH